MALTVGDGRVAPAGPSGNSMPPELLAGLTAALAGSATGGPSGSQANTAIVPLWRVRPQTRTEKVNPGQFGEMPGALPQRGRVDITPGLEYFTTDSAASSFLDMSDKDRADFAKLALGSDLVTPGNNTPDGLAAAWSKAVNYAAQYNQDRSQDKWISPWEAVQRLGAQNAAGQGGAYDPFRPRTQTQTTKRDFLHGADAESVTRDLESLYQSEMGRAPTQEERAIYQRLIQKQYDANPEITTSTTTTDPQGNSSTSAQRTGGIDQTATLLDQVRSDPEHAAYQAGATYFQAAMQALGAIA